LNRHFPDKAIDLMDEAMSVAKSKGSSYVSLEHVDEAIKNVTGANTGLIEYDYLYNELLPFYSDNYLGTLNNKCLVSINYEGDISSLEVLLREIKLGFGITEEMILKINLETFTENYSISSLIGTPPGYVGYEDGGILSEHFSKYLYQVIVIDNFSSASFDIKQLFRQIISKGVFTDKKGREFKTNNTVFIFTNSNIKNDSIGFISTIKKNKFEIKCDLTLEPKNNLVYVS
jgi:ATP-dependent Clp protease ATP-binding subunit ClpA